jgi:hypothetical protein
VSDITLDFLIKTTKESFLWDDVLELTKDKIFSYLDTIKESPTKSNINLMLDSSYFKELDGKLKHHIMIRIEYMEYLKMINFSI